MEGDVDLTGVRALLDQTAEHGFIAPATVAAVLGLEERLLIILVERLGGEVHLPAFAEMIAVQSDRHLEAEIGEDGVYVLRAVPA